MYHNPYAALDGGTWTKTNFHTHAGTGAGTCGRHSIEEVTGWYRELKYGALCISNHDLFTDTSAYDTDEMFMFPGVEYSQGEHMLTIGVNETFHELPHQQALDATRAQGGFTILCHPNWIRKEYWPWAKIDALTGYAGLEVINTLIYRLSGSGLATDTWDYLLRQGKLAYGFGDDDFHAPFDAGRGYTDIYLHSRGYAALKAAVDVGRFTASTGVRLEYLELDGDMVRVKAKFTRETYVREFRYRFVTENGLASEQVGETAAFTLSGERYVRVEAVAENGAMLFTQPVYREEYFKRP